MARGPVARARALRETTRECRATRNAAIRHDGEARPDVQAAVQLALCVLFIVVTASPILALRSIYRSD
jgi:hypothetical protein